jgi:hypothetical protein
VDAAQYAINIAAQMTGASQTYAELDQLTAKLSGGGKGAAHFQEAIKQVSAQLDVARVATASANADLARGAEEYRLLERAADQAAKKAEKAALAGKLDPTMSRDVAMATAALERQAATMKVLEGAAASAGKKEGDLVRTLGNVRTLSGHVDRSLAQQSERLSRVQGALSQIGGPVGLLGQRLLIPIKGFSEMSQSMGVMNATALITVAGVALLAAAVAALSVAFVAGVASAAAWAIKLGDTKRSAELSRDAIEQIRPGLIALRGEFILISDATGQSETALIALHKALADAKVGAAQMPAALRAAALAEAALGQGGASEFVAKIKAGTLAVDEFAANAERQFGGVVARQMLGLEMQGQRFRKNIGGLFGDLNIDSALEGLQVLVSLFDKSESSGKAIKLLFETVFQPLIDQARNAADVVTGFALGFLIGLMKVYIAVKPVLTAVAEFFGFKDTSLVEVCKSAAAAGEFVAKAFIALAAVWGVVAIAIGLILTGTVALSVAIGYLVFRAVAFAVSAFQGWLQIIQSIPAWFSAGVAAVVAFGQNVISAIGGMIDSVRGYFAGLDMATIGRDIMAGLASGIMGSAKTVVDAMGGAVRGAIDSAKRLLGIASPSKVFAGLGAYTGEGFAQGIEDQTGSAQQAMAALVEPPETPLSRQDELSGNFGAQLSQAASAPVASSAASSAPAVSMAGAILNFYGVKDGPDSADRFGEWLTKALEGDAASLGGEVAPA